LPAVFMGVKFGLSHWGRNVGRERSRVGAEEDISAYEGLGNRGVEKNT